MIKHKIARFALAGGFNTSVDWFFYYLITRIFASSDIHITAKIIGTVAGITSAYVLNYLWVFREDRIQQENSNGFRKKIRYLLGSYVKMFLTYAVGMSFNVLVFTVLLYNGFAEAGSLALATICSFFLNFIIVNNYVFNGKPVDAPVKSGHRRG